MGRFLQFLTRTWLGIRNIIWENLFQKNLFVFQERRKEKKANRLAFRAEHVKQQKEMAALHRNVKALSLSTNA